MSPSFHVCDCFSFLFVIRIPLVIFCNAGFMFMNYFSSWLSRKVLSSPSVFKYNFAYWQLFTLRDLKYIIPQFLFLWFLLNSNDFAIIIKLVFFSCTFQYSFLFHSHCILIITWYQVFLFWSCPYVVLYDSCTWMSIFFFSFGKFSSMNF